MIISDKDALSRLGSGSNLVNRLRSSREGKGLDIFTRGKGEVVKSELINPFQRSANTKEIEEPTNSPSIGELMTDVDYDIKLQTAHNKAIDVLVSTLDQLGVNVGLMKPEKLAAVAASSIKVIDSVRKEKLERAKLGKENEQVHYHFYTPQVRRLEEFEVIEVGSSKSEGARA